MWSYFVVVSVIKGLGYVGENKLWFFVGNVSVLDHRLHHKNQITTNQNTISIIINDFNH